MIKNAMAESSNELEICHGERRYKKEFQRLFTNE